MAAQQSRPTRPSSFDSTAAAVPWWRVGWMWLVVGIPAVTVIAAITTTVLALQVPDPPIATNPGAEPVHLRQAVKAEIIPVQSQAEPHP